MGRGFAPLTALLIQIDAAFNLTVHTFVILLFYIRFILTHRACNKRVCNKPRILSVI
ncbi:Uncharacterised protein [Vibrio cholerae]|nr:Uncharacterised protein [Vibrio cholerae]